MLKAEEKLVEEDFYRIVDIDYAFDEKDLDYTVIDRIKI